MLVCLFSFFCGDAIRSVRLQDTACTTPIIFVLSTGADPTSSLLRFAEEMEYQERLHVISLGQGQVLLAPMLS